MSGDKDNHRSSIKVHDIFNNYPNWKAKLRENCFKRVREDRNRLLWSLRSGNAQDYTLPPQDMVMVQSGFQDIVSDELRRLKGSALNENIETSSPRSESSDDSIWEYDGLHSAYQGDCEELLLEMQRIFYDDLRKEEESRKENDFSISSYDEEEDEYLAQAVYKHMHLNHEEVIWCPVCKQGELQENLHVIFCNLCTLKLNRDDKINLDILCTRLAEAHTDHLDKGCKLRPNFCIENQFELTALYVRCQGCNMFDIVA